MSVIEARARITAEDATGDVFNKLSKKFSELGKSARASVEMERLGKALAATGKQAGVLERFTEVRRKFDGAKTAFAETARELANVRQSMASIEKPSRAMVRQLDQAERAAYSARTAFRRHRTALHDAAKTAADHGVSTADTAAEHKRLQGAIEGTTCAMVRQAATEQKHAERQAVIEQRRADRRALGGMLVGGALVTGAHAAAHLGRESLVTYREFDKERRFGKAVMGLTDDEQKSLVDQAIHLGGTTKYNDVKVLEAQRELAARGLKKDQVAGMIDPATKLGMALDLGLPEAVQQMEGAIFGFKKDISTLDAAVASARQTADYQVKAAKISGMKPDDIVQAYKYAATPARLGDISEATLLGFAGISKKANMGGDEAGTAFRALVASSMSPTRKAKEAMLANGINFKNYQRNRDRLDLDPFVANVAAQYGVQLNGAARGKLGAIFSDKNLISDPAKFTPAVVAALRSSLGGNDAKSLKSISGAANRYRDASVQGVDLNHFFLDLMAKLPGNLQLANAIFGSKQGGRIATALGDPETFRHMIDEIQNHSSGYAGQISEERMAGFDGAVSRFEGSVKNLETAIGRAWDNDGKGGALTWVTNKLGGFIQGLAELNSQALAAASAVAAVGAGAALWKGTGLLLSGFGLKGSAVALTGSAEALTAAAARLGGGAGLPGGSSVPKGGGAAPFVPGVLPAIAAGATVTGVLAGGAALSYAATKVAQRDAAALHYPVDPDGWGLAAAVFDPDEATRAAWRKQGAGSKLTRPATNRPELPDGDFTLGYDARRGFQAMPRTGVDPDFMGGPSNRDKIVTQNALAGANIQTTVSGEVTGQVSATVTVQPGSELISIPQQMQALTAQVKGAIASLGSGSTGGTTMPQYASPGLKSAAPIR